MYDVVEVQCPWCFEHLEVGLQMDDWGQLTLDCQVCCRPWVMHVTRDEYGDPVVRVERED